MRLLMVFRLTYISANLPVMDATQDSVVLPWTVGLSSFVCSQQGGTKSMDATSLCLRNCILF